VDSLGVPFTRYLFNAIFTTVVGTFSYLFLSLITAYPIAKAKLKIVVILETLLVYAMLFHNDTMAMLRFVIMSYMGIIDTYWAVILPGFAGTMGMYLIVQFIRANIQDEILEAARIDGAGEFKILFKIVAPSIKAGWLTALIFTFQNYWNQGASPYIYTEELKHISVAMSSIAASGITRAGTGMAVTLILMIPTIIIFLWNQRSIMNTMAHSGLK
ncbi:MAG: carbohydrate ABC transporter permease, partial [Clostridia bacterium]|nr:carbohydrate ABC transporter permease [Clostridia bacterium]